MILNSELLVIYQTNKSYFFKKNQVPLSNYILHYTCQKRVVDDAKDIKT